MLVHGVLSLYKCFDYIDIVYKMLHMSIYAVIIGLCMIIGLCVRLMVAKMRHTKLLVRRDICGVGIGGVGMNGKKGEQLMNTVSWTKMHISGSFIRVYIGLPHKLRKTPTANARGGGQQHGRLVGLTQGI